MPWSAEYPSYRRVQGFSRLDYEAVRSFLNETKWDLKQVSSAARGATAGTRYAYANRAGRLVRGTLEYSAHGCRRWLRGTSGYPRVRFRAIGRVGWWQALREQRNGLEAQIRKVGTLVP